MVLATIPVTHFTVGHLNPGSVTVRLTDGIEIDLATGQTVVADAARPHGDVNVLSHAHGDHLFDATPEAVVCSELTARLAAVRRDGVPDKVRTDHPLIELLPSGHVPGSRAAWIDDGERTYLYTGDVSTRDRLYLPGFEPRPADVLIVESTYGKPAYRFPPQQQVEGALVDWLSDSCGRPALLFGYTLGRAQELQVLAGRSDRERVFVSKAIAELSSVIETALDVDLPGSEYSSTVTLGPDDVLIVPSQTTRLGFVETLVEDHGAVKAGASGWAIEDSYRYRMDLDVAFALSDHCDFDELLGLVEAVAPEQVYTNHGFSDDFATAVRSELGIPARALKRNQATLGDF